MNYIFKENKRKNLNILETSQRPPISTLGQNLTSTLRR